MTGQNHKRWCKLPCGEEDVDYEIRFISPSRGYGVVALRDFVARERIFVERLFSLQEIKNLSPANLASFMDLAPSASSEEAEEESLENKFYSNCISVRDSQPALGLRLSRVNHACFPNADWWDDKKELILVTRSPVSTGEEFTFSYTNHMDPVIDGWSSEKARELLIGKWGIKCAPECECYDQRRVSQIQKARALESIIPHKIQKNLTIDAFHISEALLQLHKDIKSSEFQQMSVMYNVFCIGIVNESTEAIALIILRNLRNLSEVLFGSTSASTIEYESLLKSPESHPNHFRHHIR